MVFEGLTESAHFWEKDTDSEDIYIYFSRSNVFPLCHFDEELRNINDYCLHLFESLNDKVKEINSDILGIKKSGETYIDEELGDVTDDVLMGLSEELPQWESNIQYVLKPTCVSLILSFLEMSLKSIIDLNKSFANKIREAPKKTRGSKIDMYISELDLYFSSDITMSNNHKSILDFARKYRNMFAHGDWEKMAFEERFDITLRELIGVVSSLLSQIEEKMIEEEIVEGVW